MLGLYRMCKPISGQKKSDGCQTVQFFGRNSHNTRNSIKLPFEFLFYPCLPSTLKIKAYAQPNPAG